MSVPNASVDPDQLPSTLTATTNPPSDANNKFLTGAVIIVGVFGAVGLVLRPILNQRALALRQKAGVPAGQRMKTRTAQEAYKAAGITSGAAPADDYVLELQERYLELKAAHRARHPERYGLLKEDIAGDLGSDRIATELK
jgi:hypothetical protein